jgi:sulfide:quinone oxidoreductase
MSSSAETKPRVLIVGGGIAGLEAALALNDLAAGLADVALLAPEPDFLFKPLTVEEPFTGTPTERHELAPALAELGVELVPGALESVSPDEHEVTTGDGDRLRYDSLIVCVGARPRPAFAGVETFWSNRADLPADELIRAAHRSPSAQMTLVAPPGTTWPLPLYELALLLRKRSEELGLSDLGLRLVTPEPAPLAVFGVPASAAVSDLLRARRISVVTDCFVVQEDHDLRLAREGAPVGDEVVIALPVIEGPRVAGLPADAQGFMPIDEYARVEGVADVYAAGDGTNFPVKQGGLATQQADAAAMRIAADLGGPVEPEPFRPLLRGQLIAGADSLHMRHGLSGGQGEGLASPDYLWWPPSKVAGRYLAAWLGHTSPTDLDPPHQPLEVEVSWPHDWHGIPMAYDAELP